MKNIISILALFASMASCAITLDVRKAANHATTRNNTGYSSARSSASSNAASYDIFVEKGKYDKGKYKLFAMTLTLVMVSNGGSGSTRSYVWIPDSYKEIEIDAMGKSRYSYTTPTMKFEKEKWEYFGDYSKGAKLNGVFVGICDTSLAKPKIVKFFKQCSAPAPRNMDEVVKFSTNEKVKEILDELDYLDTSSCCLNVEIIK